MNVRIVAATNKDLEDEVRTNRFREDFLEKMNAVESKLVKGFEDNVTEALMNYRWPGNVRELENIVERAYILCPNITLTKKYLPSMLTGDTNEQGVDEMNLEETEKRLIMKALTVRPGIRAGPPRYWGLPGNN